MRGNGRSGHTAVMMPFSHAIPQSIWHKIRLVKIDVEGAEYHVLRGLDPLLKSPYRPYILCELNPEFISEMGGSVCSLLEFMTARHYRLMVSQTEGAKEAGWHVDPARFDSRALR